MKDIEYKIGYVGTYTISAPNEIMAQRKLIDWMRKCPYGEITMGRFIESEKVYEHINGMDNENASLN